MPDFNFDQTNAALIQGAMQLGNNIVSSAEQYKWSKKAAEDQNKRALEWWNMQNEYNTPKSQMSRFIEAGLNPNLIYGQMSSSNAGNIGTPAVATRQSATAGIVSSAVNTALQLLRNKEEVKHMQLLNEKLNSEINFGSIGLDQELASSLGLPSRLDSYSDYVGYKYLHDLGTRFLKYVNYENLVDYNNARSQREQQFYQYEKATLADRIKSALFRNRLMEGEMAIQQAAYRYKQQVNDWFKANQIFNMVDRTAGRILDFIPAPKVGKWLKKGSYKDSYGGTSYEYEKFY